MDDLIKRLEKAEELDVDLFMAVQQSFDCVHGRLYKRLLHLAAAGAYLDAALALVGECGQVVRYINWHRFEGHPEVVHATVGKTQPEGKTGQHKSPAIALLIALLQAKEASDE